MTEAEYRADQAVRHRLIELTLKVTSESKPIPTQDELDLTRLGLMPDGVADPHNPEMPPVAVQQAMFHEGASRSGATSHAASAPSAPAGPRQAPRV